MKLCFITKRQKIKNMKTIYIIKNDINNFVYIGQTGQTLDNRLKHHFSNIKSGKTKFVKAMRTIGKNHFYIEEIEKVSNEKANERELYWIQYYSKITKIYNTKFSLGKCGGDTLSNHPNYNEISKKISQKVSGGKNGHSTKIKVENVLDKTMLNFDSISECQKYFNIPRHDIVTRRCQGKIKRLWKGIYNFSYL